MLSDLPLSVSPTASTVATGHTAMQLDTTNCSKVTDTRLALLQALLNRTNWTTRRTRMLIQTLLGTDDNRRCVECRRTFSTTKRLKIHVPQHFTVTFCPCGVHTVSLRSLLSRFRHCFMLYINGFQGIARTVFVSH